MALVTHQKGHMLLWYTREHSHQYYNFKDQSSPTKETEHSLARVIRGDNISKADVYCSRVVKEYIKGSRAVLLDRFYVG